MATQMINQLSDGGSIPASPLHFKYKYCVECGAKRKRLQDGYCRNCWFGLGKDKEYRESTNVSR